MKITTQEIIIELLNQIIEQHPSNKQLKIITDKLHNYTRNQLTLLTQMDNNLKLPPLEFPIIFILTDNTPTIQIKSLMLPKTINTSINLETPGSIEKIKDILRKRIDLFLTPINSSFNYRPI